MLLCCAPCPLMKTHLFRLIVEVVCSMLYLLMSVIIDHAWLTQTDERWCYQWGYCALGEEFTYDCSPFLVFVVVSIIVFRLWKVLISIGVLLEVWRVSFWLLGFMVCVWTLTGMCEHCLWSVSVVLFKNLSESLNLWSQLTWWVHY